MKKQAKNVILDFIFRVSQSVFLVYIISQFLRKINDFLFICANAKRTFCQIYRQNAQANNIVMTKIL